MLRSVHSPNPENFLLLLSTDFCLVWFCFFFRYEYVPLYTQLVTSFVECDNNEVLKYITSPLQTLKSIWIPTFGVKAR